MNIEDVQQKRSRLEEKANEEIQKALASLQGDLSRSNDMVSGHVNKDGVVTPTPTTDEQKEILPAPKTSTPPLIYFAYPQASETPPWVESLRQVLVSAGYLVYNPWEKVTEQIGQKDVPLLDEQPIKIIKNLCPILAIPEEVVLPFEAVWKILQQGDAFDNFSIVFKNLWFLVRSSLVVCDLMRATDTSTAQEILYAKQLGIPVIGLLPTSGFLNPWAHRTTTALFSGTDLLSLLPMIQGYAPR